MNIEETFKSMAGAKMNGKGNYIEPGRYIVAPRLLKLNEGYNGKAFVSEWEVCESTNPNHKIGSTVSYVVNLKRDQAMGDLKALFFALAMGRDPKLVASDDTEAHEEVVEYFKGGVSAEHAAAIGEAPGWLIGRRIALETVKVPTKPKTAGGPPGEFTVHNWSPAPAKTAAAA